MLPSCHQSESPYKNNSFRTKLQLQYISPRFTAPTVEAHPHHPQLSSSSSSSLPSSSSSSSSSSPSEAGHLSRLWSSPGDREPVLLGECWC